MKNLTQNTSINQQNSTLQTICVDWLELSFSGTLPSFKHNPQKFELTPDCYLEFTDLTSKFFGAICNLYVDGYKVGEVKFNPKSAFIGDETIQFKFENYMLYTNDFTSYVSYFIEKLNWKFNHIIRLDIASDVIKHNVLNFIQKQKANPDKITLKGKRKNVSINLVGEVYQTVYFGSASSDKFIKVYNKTKELQKSNKKHIEVFWKYNGLDFKNNEVERVELTLRQKHLKHINVYGLNNANYLASICRTHFVNYFDFSEVYSSHGKKYTKDVTPIRFSQFETQLLPKYKFVPKYSVKPIKTELKRLYFNSLIELEQCNMLGGVNNLDVTTEYYMAQINITKVINRLVNVYHLEAYFKQNKPFWLKEYEKNKTLHINRFNNAKQKTA